MTGAELIEALIKQREAALQLAEGELAMLTEKTQRQLDTIEGLAREIARLRADVAKLQA